MSRLVLETGGKVDPEMLCYDILRHVNQSISQTNGVAGAEDDAVTADRVENAVAAEQGEIVGAVERQDNDVREPEVNVGGKIRR
jgi:hypothetical protein